LPAALIQKMARACAVRNEAKAAKES